MANHDLSTRMGHIRMALADPRLTNRQQKTLAALMTFMPFETEQGWILKAQTVSASIYFGRTPTNTQMRKTREILKELEDLGMISRIYPNKRTDKHSDPTFFVNWDRLLEPYREALRAETQTAQGGPLTLPKVGRPSLYVVPGRTQGDTGNREQALESSI